MPLGYGGYEKDNALAYSDVEERPEDRVTRKEAKRQEQRQAKKREALTRRQRLGRVVEQQQSVVENEARQVREEDLEFVHGEEDYDERHRAPCCEDRYVDFDLEHGRAQLIFIRKGLLPVMVGYGVTTLYATSLIFNNTLREYFYRNSPIYALISLGSWFGLNIFGRLVRNIKFVAPMMLMRSMALCNLLGSCQLYSEFFIWEILFKDTADLETPTVIELEENLAIQLEYQVPNSWLDLPRPEDATKNDFLNRTEFSRAFFGALLGFSLFLPICCIMIGLSICSKKEHLPPHQVTGVWMQRAAAIAGILPSILLFFLNDTFAFIPGPRSYNFLQIYPIGLTALACGVYVSAMWTPLFSGNSCFNVHYDDYLYFGFMFTI